MENVICKEITLPSRVRVFGLQVCQECCGVARPCVFSRTFNYPQLGEKITISGIQGYKCVECEAEYCSPAEAELVVARIRKVLRSSQKKPLAERLGGLFRKVAKV